MTTIGSTGASTPAQPTTTTAPASPVSPGAARTLGYAPFAASAELAQVLSGARTLAFGERGAHVKLVEEALIALGYPPQAGAAAGDRLTRATQAALSRFQRDQGLGGSGAVDAETLAALDAQSSRRTGAGAAGGAGGGSALATGRGAIAAALRRVTADGVLDKRDVGALFAAAGDKVSSSELQEIRAATANQGRAGTFRVADDARTEALARATAANITGREKTQLASGVSFGGTKVPDAVKKLVSEARLAGAVAYDVNETKTKANGEEEGVWSPYPATTKATGNMAFNYTEITPEKLKADMADTSVRYRAMVGTTKEKDASGEEVEKVAYEWRTGGTGNILATYDEVGEHEDIYARGAEGQKWSNNFAILSDGSIHCLPAARRSEAQDLILTNPHLSRGKHMLFNGHLDVRDGVVVGVEMSGKLSSMAGKGDEVFVDPIAVLKAWGFQVAPDVRLQYGNVSSGTPVQDAATGTIRAARP